MLPVLISAGPMTIPTFGFFAVLAFIAASFLLWRKLKEDYPEEEIISFTILLTLFAILGGRIFYLVGHFSEFNFNLAEWIFWTRYPGFSLPGAFLSMIPFALWWTRKNNWDFWVVVDGAVWGLLAALLLGSFGAWFSDGAPPTSAKIMLAVLLFPLTFYLFRNFRKFIWYKSGKPGFVACAVSSFYFLGLIGLDFWFRITIYLDIAMGLIIGGLGLVFLYHRSERKILKDVAGATQFLRSFKR